MNGNKLLTMVAASLVFLGALAGLAGVADAADPEPEPEYTKYWSWTLGFSFTGSDAQTIEWDFGDGSPVVSGGLGDPVWNVEHKYPEIEAKYTVTQTVTNEIGSVSIERYIWVMGPPVLTFVGIDLDPVTHRKGDIPEMPADPSAEGAEFEGWYADEACTIPFDWEDPIMQHTTAYAKWDGTAPVVEDDDGDGEDGKAINLPALITAIVVAIAGLLLIVYAGRPGIGIAVIIIAAIVALWSAGILPEIKMPEIPEIRIGGE